MRVNLITHALSPCRAGAGTFPVSLTIRPACGLPGDYQYPTDTAELLKMLHQQTDLPEAVLQRFKGDLCSTQHARLMGVELNERILTKIGYFVD